MSGRVRGHGSCVKSHMERASVCVGTFGTFLFVFPAFGCTCEFNDANRVFRREPNCIFSCLFGKISPFPTCSVDVFSGAVPVGLKVWGEEVAVLSLRDLWCYNEKNVELVHLSALGRAFILFEEMSYHDFLDMLKTA